MSTRVGRFFTTSVVVLNSIHILLQHIFCHQSQYKLPFMQFPHLSTFYCNKTYLTSVISSGRVLNTDHTDTHRPYIARF